MQAALWVAKTGLAAQDVKMATISNNLANVNTVGFKRDRTSFEDLFYQIERQPGAQQDFQNQLPTGVQVGTGVRLAGTEKVHTPGNFENTGQDLDVAIVGKGFFQIEQPNGELAYTRNGQFQRNAEGLMVNTSGLPLVPQIQIPEDAVGVSIGTDGIVMAKLAGDPVPQQIGQIATVNFANPAGLEAQGGNLFLETASSGQPLEGIPGENALGPLKQKSLESSNVSVVEEMVSMIATQRAYEMNAKVVSATDEMLRFASQSM
ncbi:MULTISPECIES: flagellar basal-body rod protein FlgG [Marinobacter]|uniref:flagellar basal-body rod protein FlgG n=1 Tax=Marinobacter TaxID=2742 RepID=UPI001D05F82B|nr:MULTISPECIES: flagellar basal-body rod protein FlgG [Marinobacter]MCG8517633.1 flagellar basal-body rod protein FlgG [Pseudomonadales bacterium]MCK7567356.1 flagellar basal-body rod protein FlgG [Marinobacter xestospongiae]UDL05528.1 flagellar basal-body rod protein FlgG [Marinobacter sp. CA1]